MWQELSYNNFVRPLICRTKDFLEFKRDRIETSSGFNIHNGGIIIFIMANVNTTNKNSSVVELAIMLDELLCQKNEKNLMDILKTLNLRLLWIIKISVF